MDSNLSLCNQFFVLFFSLFVLDNNLFATSTNFIKNVAVIILMISFKRGAIHTLTHTRTRTHSPALNNSNVIVCTREGQKNGIKSIMEQEE